MASDIVVSVRYNNIYRIRQSEVGHEDMVTERIKEIMKEFEKRIKDLTTAVVEVHEDEQKAIDIGRNILDLIETKVQENIDVG